MALSPNGKRIGRPPRNVAVQHNEDEMDEPNVPTAPIVGSPEFNAAVAAAVQAALEAQREAQQPVAAAPQMPDFLEAMRMLAKEIVNANKESLNSEKRQRGELVPLTVDEAAAREEARQSMGGLIMEARAHQKTNAVGEDVPVYRVMSEVWLAENLIVPYRRFPGVAEPQPVQIRWTGEPNLQMLPVNASAKKIFSSYLRYLGGSGAINEVIDQFGISLVTRTDKWVSENGRLTTVAPSDSHRMLRQVPNDPIDLANYEGVVDDPEDPMRIMTANDPRHKNPPVNGTLHKNVKRGSNFADKVSMNA